MQNFLRAVWHAMQTGNTQQQMAVLFIHKVAISFSFPYFHAIDKA